MLVYVTITALLSLMESVNCGYIYHRPSITFNLPKIEPLFQREHEYVQKQSVESNLPVTSTVLGDVINRYPHIPCSNIPVVTAAPLVNTHSNLEFNTAGHFDVTTDDTPNINLLALTQGSNLNINTEQYIDIPRLNNPSELPQNNPHNNLEFTAEQQQDEDNDLADPINVQNVISPKIMKHVYFHVPPPEMEEPPVYTVIPKKKIYKIIFIKVPSHDTSDFSQSNGNAYNQISPIQEKTIIYVLSKKPTIEPVFLPKPVPSQHEVFFVKYSGDPAPAITQINNSLPPDELSSSIQDSGTSSIL